MAIMKEMFPVRSDLSGVTFEGRQTVIAALSNGTPLVFKPQPWNRYDPKAVNITTDAGADVGFLPNRTSAEKEFKDMVLESMKAGEIIACACGKRGGTDGKNYGLSTKFYLAPWECFIRPVEPEPEVVVKPRGFHPTNRYDLNKKYKGKDLKRLVGWQEINWAKNDPCRKALNHRRRAAFKHGEDIKPNRLEWRCHAYMSDAEAKERFMERRCG